MDKYILTGLTTNHVKSFQEGLLRLIPEVAEAYQDMCSAANKDGLEIYPVSTFRGFEDQLRIWNRKFNGEQNLLDLNEKKIDFDYLTESEKIEKILYWSALPGTSRHHWGTDIDVIDQITIRENINYQLVPSESQPNGIFHQLHQWIQKECHNFGFHFPYQGLNDDMYLEPWHISYSSISNQCLSFIDCEMIREVVFKADISGKLEILNALDTIFQKKVLNVVSC